LLKRQLKRVKVNRGKGGQTCKTEGDLLDYVTSRRDGTVVFSLVNYTGGGGNELRRKQALTGSKKTGRKKKHTDGKPNGCRLPTQYRERNDSRSASFK